MLDAIGYFSYFSLLCVYSRREDGLCHDDTKEKVKRIEAWIQHIVAIVSFFLSCVIQQLFLFLFFYFLVHPSGIIVAIVHS
jgi:hypothetical protein